MATGDLHTKFCEDWFSGSRDQTHRQTDKLIEITARLVAFYNTWTGSASIRATPDHALGQQTQLYKNVL